MATVSVPDRGNVAGMPRGGEPIVNGGANPPALHRRRIRTMMAGDQQHDAIAAVDRLLNNAVDGCPRCVQIHAMKIEHTVGLDGAAPELFVPAPIESFLGDRNYLCRPKISP
jgi:hypothetical protein